MYLFYVFIKIYKCSGGSDSAASETATTFRIQSNMLDDEPTLDLQYAHNLYRTNKKKATRKKWVEKTMRFIYSPILCAHSLYEWMNECTRVWVNGENVCECRCVSCILPSNSSHLLNGTAFMVFNCFLRVLLLRDEWKWSTVETNHDILWCVP